MSEERAQRVVVALSGGVDSAVAAALLVEQGYDVVGVMLRLWVEPGSGGDLANRCCTPEAVERAQRVASRLDIPFYLINAEAGFKTLVVDYLIAEYGSGRTPNPCISCNRAVRFGFLLDQALALGAEYLATGHYARVRQGEDGYQLLRGIDSAKDQSYFLHTLSQTQLNHVLLPVGGLTKDEVRAAARRFELPVAEQPESQDLCFVSEGDYRAFLARHAPHLFQPGPIRDSSGQVLGQHQGLPAYTIGQRKGLGLAAAEPLYVLALLPEDNALVVGPVEELGRDECVVEKMHYIGRQASASFRAQAQIRYRAAPVDVEVALLPGERARVHFAAPQRDITPGQFLVLYDGELVFGGGVICMAQESVL
jgi:tRNA-specific 2-thiouridylase